MKGGTLLLNGFLAGCVLWIKYSLLGLHFAWMAVIAIESVVRERRILPAVKMCLIFLAGMALSSLPWLIYFGANGAIGDLIDVYFVQNITGYTTDDGFFYNLIHGLGNDALDNLPLALLIFIGGVYAICAGGWKHLWFKICTAAMAVCMAVLLYMGGRFRGYTFYVFAAFLPLLAVAAGNLLSDGRRLRKAGGMALALLLGALCVYEAIDSRGMLDRIRWNEKNMVQYVFAEEINKTENPTLLNCGFLDGGFYLAADVIPTERWFCKLNVAGDTCFEAQSSAVKEGRVDYVVTWKNTLEDLNMDSSRYDLVREYKDYYLYKLENASN